MGWTKEKMVEAVKVHHPHLGETEILDKLNRAMEHFCDHTGIHDRQDNSITTVANKTYYNIPARITRILSVWFNGVKIPRLIGKPAIDDPDTMTES